MDLKPGVIKKLETDVINRIAAGEIIQRPANAVKELIENSLDAKSSSIQIIVKDGGLKLLQIQDNGTGIRREDFEIVCERFTTSKLRKFEDLEMMSTYGFRGEALASISHVAHLSIVSKTHSSQCSYKAFYTDGVLKGDVKPLAGNQGTTITVEDLFYNLSVRKAALRSPAEEYAKIADVVGKYAVHNPTTGFSLKKQGDIIDIRTMANSNELENIRMIFGQSIAKELLDFSLTDEAFKFHASGHVTNLNYSSKKIQFLLFINHRLVDCASLKRRIEQMYTTYLPKNCHPFVYLALELDPKTVDVNVHPTKHEVRFLNEDQIVDAITAAIESKLLDCNNSRTFYAQGKYRMTITHLNKTTSMQDEKTLNKIYDKDLVRTDTKEQKLEKFFGRAKTADEVILNKMLKKTQQIEEKLLEQTINEPGNCAGADQDNAQAGRVKSQSPTSAKSHLKSFKPESNFLSHKHRTVVRLGSVIAMQTKIEESCDEALREVFEHHVFVGVATAKQSLIQHGVRLLLIHTEKLMRELFYQCIAYNFQNFDMFHLTSPLSVHDLLEIALNQSDVGWTEEDGDKHELTQNALKILMDKSDMLRAYFALDITNEGMLCSLPVLIAGHMPSEAGLPRYLLRLACEVNWDEEQPCFESFARETATYYAESPLVKSDEWKHIVEHVFYPFIKDYFLPPQEFKTNGTILEAANLPQLYKVFERC